MSTPQASTTRDLSPEQISLLPSSEEVQAYVRLGWHISPVIIDDATLEAAIAGAHAFYEGHRDHELRGMEHLADNPYDTRVRLINNEMVALRVDALASLAYHPMVVATAARLAQTPLIRYFADSLLLKRSRPSSDRPEGSVVGWHTDKAYWPTCTSTRMLTAWIALSDCTVDMGTPVYVEGSNQWDHGPFAGAFGFGRQQLGDLDALMQQTHPNARRIQVAVKRGQVSFHNCRTIHASGSNTSGRDRLALAVHYQDAHNRYKGATAPDGSPIVISYDHLCRRDAQGKPDYRDPDVFPVLWQEP